MKIGHFLQLSGLVLLGWGIAAWFMPWEEGDEFYTDVGYNVFYLSIGLLVLWIGTTWNPELRRIWTVFTGILFLAISVMGWAVVGRDDPNFWVVNFENPVDNLVHLGVGLAFFVGAMFCKTDAIYPEPPGTTMNVR